jgi:glycosyltransferase involved in cell wall biosynthesis
MKNDPLVSIVLPTYNGSRYVAQSIQSCIDQTYRNWELIIVDDCSTDETPAIIERFVRQDQRISSVRHGKNRRLPRGLNTGFARSKGTYLTWTSDDNLYEPNALEVMVRYLEDNPTVGVVYCDERWIGPEGEDKYLFRKDGPDQLGVYNVVNACFLYRRAVYEAVGEYDPKMALVEDWEYWLRVAKRFPLAHLPGVAPYRYRWHPQSLTCTRRGAAIAQQIRARGRHLVPPSERRAYMTEALWSATWNFHHEGNLGAAFQCALACWKVAPWRLRFLKAVLGTGLRHWGSGSRPDATYSDWKPDGRKFVPLTRSSTTGEALQHTGP